MKIVTNKSGVINRVLFGLVSLYFNNLVEASEAIGVSYGILSRSIIHGYLPTFEIQNKISSYFGIPEYIVFNEKDIKRSKLIPLEKRIKKFEDKYVHPQNEKGSRLGIGVKKKRFRVSTKKKIILPVLYALLLSENIKISELASMINRSSGMTRKYITGDYNVPENIQLVIESILDMDKQYIFFRFNE